MVDSAPCENLVSDVDSLHILNQLHGGHNKQCVFTKNSTCEGYILGELESRLSEVLHFQEENHILVSDSKKSQMENGDVFEELKINLPDLSSATDPSALSRSATFPFSKKEMTDQAHEQSEYPICTRSASLPVPLKLMSAMKGGREKQGIPPKKLTVTWAADVYDPPTTSVSHSVKGGYSHHRSSRSSKKSSSSSSSSKHKHKGGKSSSRSSSSSDNYKKHYHHRKHIGGHYESRMKPVETKDRLPSLLNNMNHHSTIEISEFSVATSTAVQDNNTKCGTSYFMKSLTEVHLPVGEAT